MSHLKSQVFLKSSLNFEIWKNQSNVIFNCYCVEYEGFKVFGGTWGFESIVDIGGFEGIVGFDDFLR